MTTPSPLHAAHPSPSTWQEYLDAPIASRDRAMADHLRRCAACEDTVRFLSALAERVEQLPIEPAPHELRARMLASRAAGVRVLVPEHVDPSRPASPRGQSSRCSAAHPSSKPA
jgi:hypothetical protein